MSSGERPIGAAKGKQSDTAALCQTPNPPPAPGTQVFSSPELILVPRETGREGVPQAIVALKIDGQAVQRWGVLQETERLRAFHSNAVVLQMEGQGVQ